MRIKQYFHLILFSFFLVFSLDGCKSKNEVDLPDKPTTQLGDLEITELKEIATQTIGTEGGVLEVKDAQSSLNGFKISVPVGVYSSASSFSVSAANVVKQSFGDEYKVLSPLISITAPTGYINDFATIEVPITLPKDHFAVAVFINEEGKLDLLPMISISDNKIVVATNSFSPVTQLKNGRAGSVFGLRFFILDIEEKLLMNLEYATDFKPGQDDWAFTNYGSIAAETGYCSASSFSSLWYFKNKKAIINKPLYQLGKAPNALPTVKSDASHGQLNSAGIKYVSVLQNLDSQLDNVAKAYKDELEGISKQRRDKLTLLFASAYLKIFNEPLLLGLDHDLVLPGITRWGHMIRIIGKRNEGLTISDPNIPGITSLLEYSNQNGFEYYTAESTSDLFFSTDTFFALPPWVFNKDINTEIVWPDFENGSILNSSFFPSFSYTVHKVGDDVNETVLEPSTVSKIGSPFLIEIGSKKTMKTRVVLFTETGDTLKTSTDYYALPTGIHKIGVMVKVENEKKQLKWADFQWFDIEIVKDNYSNCQITTPEAISIDKPGEVGKQYTFSLGTECQFPPKTLFFWDFGDGATDEAVDNPVARHTFAKSGDFTVKLRVLMEGVAEYVNREVQVKIGVSDDTGPDYFTYKVNGKVFSSSDPRTHYVTSPINQGLFIDYLNSFAGYKVVNGRGWDDAHLWMYMGVSATQHLLVGSYPLTKPEKGKPALALVAFGTASTEFADSGTLTITRRDNTWIEGNFSFNVGAFAITEGKFRIKLI